MNSHQLQTEIEIDAEAQRVWSILADFAAYPEWNPFIRSIRGVMAQGSRLEVRIQPSGAKGMTFRPSILVADPGRELRWLGRLMLPGLFDGEHRLVIEPVAPGKVRFRQNERFSGILVPLFRNSLDRDTKRGFEEMNRALKARAEA
ncbi:MAG: SRPBCC domain-containing protein [Deltaproteobacteria bacterium HGW-Deltaproteobacteria-6]|nr:MAG: SRPBCC domain-containing protein [Deltaproteobacteria bacterium HGW-Deltaproteobacteria-6]